MTDKKDEKTPEERRALDSNAFERELTTDLRDSTPDKPRGFPLHTRILLGLFVGAAAGVAVNGIVGGGNQRVVWVINHITDPIGQLFLRLPLMVVIPLVFSSLIVGVAGMGNIRKLGRVGIKALGYTL